ncbi:MAG TPA: C1 family peptidase, partial [Patescibacteria group bacterium]|nr:C1 family peptidase [Patescibacteria group bacterium]
ASLTPAAIQFLTLSEQEKKARFYEIDGALPIRKSRDDIQKDSVKILESADEKKIDDDISDSQSESVIEDETTQVITEAGEDKVAEAEIKTASAPGPKYNLPDSFDWRNYNGKNYITSVKEQEGGNCSCFYFSAIGATEGVINAYYNNPAINQDLSESDFHGCNGFMPKHTDDWQKGYTQYFDGLVKLGVTSDKCMPAESSCMDKCSTWQNDVWKAKGYINLSGKAKMTGQGVRYMISKSVDDIRRALIKYGPLSVQMSVTENFLYYDGGIYDPMTDDSGYLGGHQVVIVGYGVQDNTGYWIVKNSWSDWWGEDGFFQMNINGGLQNGLVLTPTEPYPLQKEKTPARVCEDKDNDGYCFWGLGKKPDTCPTSCASKSIMDCDDKNGSIYERCGVSADSKGIINLKSCQAGFDVYVSDKKDFKDAVSLGKTPLRTKVDTGIKYFKISSPGHNDMTFKANIEKNVELPFSEISLWSIPKIISPNEGNSFAKGADVGIEIAPLEVKRCFFNSDYTDTITVDPAKLILKACLVDNPSKCRNIPVNNKSILKTTWKTKGVPAGDYLIKATIPQSVNYYLDDRKTQGWNNAVTFESGKIRLAN